MGAIADILESKGNDVHTIDPDASVFAAVSAMVENNVGALLVTDGDDIAGIITERDYLRRIAVEGRTSRDTRVAEIMSSPVVYVGSDCDIEEAMAIMTDRRIRHLPVVDEGSLTGVVSIGDLVKHRSEEQAFEIKYLTEYISSR